MAWLQLVWQIETVVVVPLEAKAVCPPQRTEESWTPAGAGQQPASASTMANLFRRFLFLEAAGSPRWNGVAFQDTKLGAGGGFLGTGGRKV